MRAVPPALLAVVMLPTGVAAGPVLQVSGPSPFADCRSDLSSAQTGVLFPGSEVEPRIAVDPSNPNHLVGVYQQDRWSTGGARGIVAAISFDGGGSWRTVIVPGLGVCAGGARLRASDPWGAFAPNGDVFVSSLVFDPDVPNLRTRNGVAVSRSLNGGLTWDAPS